MKPFIFIQGELLHSCQSRTLTAAHIKEMKYRSNLNSTNQTTTYIYIYIQNCIEDEGLDRGKLLQRDHPLPTWPTGILQDRQLHYFRTPRRTEARRETLKKFKKATMVTLLSRDHSYDRLNLLLRQQTQPPED